MRKLFGLSVAVLMMLTILNVPARALSPEQHGEIAQLALMKHIRPGYAALLLAASELETGMHEFCERATTENRTAINQQFETLLLSWSRIDHIRFGPMSKQHRIERFVFWPDHKGIGLRQVKKALRAKNKDVLHLPGLQGKSVALQGLTALEYLLYGTGSDKLGQKSEEGWFRCMYAVSITQNLATISKEVVGEWQDGSKFVKLYLNPSKDNDVYMAHSEVTLGLFLSFTTELKIVHLLKLGRPLGKSVQKARPKRAAFWRSKLEYKVMDANMAGIRALFDKVFSRLVANSDPGAEEGVELDFEQVHQYLTKIKMPIGEAVSNEAGRAKLKNLLTTIDQIKRDAGRAIIKAANLSMGFNALDGD